MGENLAFTDNFIEPLYGGDVTLFGFQRHSTVMPALATAEETWAVSSLIPID